MKRKFILLHSAGYKTEEVFEKRVAHRGLKLIEMIHYSFNCKLPIYRSSYQLHMNRESSRVRRFPRKTIDKKLCRAISQNKASTSLVLWKLDGICRNDFVITTVSNSRAQCREMICTWMPGLIRFQTGCRSRLAPDAVPSPHGRLVQPFRFVKLPSNFCHLFFLLLPFLPLFFPSRELGQSWSKRAIERITINWIQVFVTSALSVVVCFPLNRNANVKRAHASHIQIRYVSFHFSLEL